MAYATTGDEELARKKGYTVSRSAERGSAFQQGTRHIWSTRIGWQTADLIAGNYRHHAIFPELIDALERKL
jgi:crotonobetainyl-CoA:carnitine CoA-transferase CaiB-like acyl-CoA transferase